MDRFRRRIKTLRAHHQKSERRYEQAQAEKDHCPRTAEHLEENRAEEPHEACYSPTQFSEDEPQTSDPLDKDYEPPKSPSSSEEELLLQESQSSCHSTPLKLHLTPDKHDPHPSSSDTDTGQAKNQKNQGKSVKMDKQLKGKGKFKEGKLKITVKKSKNKDGVRVWDKAHYCIYCQKAQKKIARHLERKHSDEREVAYAFSFPVGSKQRKIQLEGLRNKGDWLHNHKVLEEGNGEIVTWKRPSEKVDIERYLPCQHCYAMFKRTELWRHEKSCRERKEERRIGKSVQKSSSHLLPVKSSCNNVGKIIHSMLQDHVTSQIRSDEMICSYGDALFAKKGREQSQHRYIAQKLRELGRFMVAVKEMDKRVKNLKDICDPSKFELAIKAARHVSNYDANKNEYGKPSTAVKIGFSLKGATEAWIGRCLMKGDVATEKKAKKFKELLENSWSIYVSTNAHGTMEQRRWGKEDSIPLTEDVLTLQSYLRKVEDEAKAKLGECVTPAEYRLLSESLLAQIIVFNKKREGEASRLTLDTYLNADKGPLNKDIYETLSTVEKQMSKRLTRLVTRGKRGRKVPILLLERTKASLDFLVEKRSEVGILEENPFLFARLGTTTNLRGCDCLRKFAEESKANNPELLRSTKLRKHVATLCQLLDLSSQELEQVARFMGHDIRVHCEFYRQTDKTFQVAKIGKLLFAMEHGADSLKEKSLQTLDSVINNKRPAATPTKCPRAVKKRRTPEAGAQLEAHDDEEQLSSTNSLTRGKKRTVTTPRDDYDGDDEASAAASSGESHRSTTSRGEDDGGAEEEDGSNDFSPGTEDTELQDPSRGPGKRPTDDEDLGETGPGPELTDGEEPHSTTGSSSVDKPKRMAAAGLDDGDDEDSSDSEHGERDRKGRVLKKSVKKQKHQGDNGSDGEHRLTSGPKVAPKGHKKPAVPGEGSDADSANMVRQKQGKRPWNDQERNAVTRRLAKFIALKKVPGKQDCLMCISKESPVLRARGWKDVKYFVYNEIAKAKRKLF